MHGERKRVRKVKRGYNDGRNRRSHKKKIDKRKHNNDTAHDDLF